MKFPVGENRGATVSLENAAKLEKKEIGKAIFSMMDLLIIS